MVSLTGQLLEGWCADSAKALSNKADKSGALEDLQGLSRKNVQRVSTALAEKIGAALEQLSADYGEQDENMPDSPDKSTIAEAESYIKSSVTVLRGFVEVYDASIPEELEEVILVLCGQAILGFPSRDSLQDAVARLGLEFLCSNAPSRLSLSVQLVPHLLWKILQGDVKAADAKRLNQAATAGAFQILDFEQAESADTIEMILRVSMNPIMLHNPEGKRCIASFFDLGPNLARNLMATIRAQIQMGKEVFLEAYGEILYKAWQNCSDENRDYIEECIQDLMNAAILARTSQLHTNVERVLSCLHDQKSTPVVQEMLQRLYKPILWPALAAPNELVRRNAISMLLSAFPITDGRSSDKEVLEETVTMQVTRIAAAMRDTDPAIRKQVAAGACLLLSRWWELLTNFGGQLIGKLMALLKGSAFDAESPKTRLAVVEGMALLVENPLSQTAVGVMLRDLKPLLYDPSRSVRRAMVELVHQVANIKSFKWWEIFPPADLMSIMGADHKEVAGVISNMLFTNFVDGDDLNLQACAGLMQILRDNQSAGVAFCRELADRAVSKDDDNISVESVSAFAVDLADYLASCTVKTVKAKGKTAKAAKTGDEGSDARTDVPEAGSGRSTRGKRPRQDEEDEQKIDAAEQMTASTSSKKKSRRAGGVRKRAESRDATEAENLLQDTLPAKMLVELLKNAPTVHGVQQVLSIGAAAPVSEAGMALAQHCLEQVQTGSIDLPNLRKKTGGKAHNITFASVSRQGHLPAEQCKLASVLCVMMDLLVSCDSAELVKVLCNGLGAQPDLPPAAGSKRSRKTASKKKGKAKASDDTVLDVSGVLTLLPMLFRAGADVQKIDADGLADLIPVLGEATAQWTARLSAGHVAATAVLYDAMLTSHCFHNASALAAGQAVAASSRISGAVVGHVDMVQQQVLQMVDQDSLVPVDVDEVCAQLFALLSDPDTQDAKKVKRTRTTDTDWRATDQQSTVLNILSHCTLDLGKGANVAMDEYQELLHAAGLPEEEGGVSHAAVEEAEARAMTACTRAGDAVKAVVQMHTAFVMDHIADPSMKQALWSSTMESIRAVHFGLEAALRGLEMDQKPGDLEALMAILGVHCTIAQTVCNLNNSKATLSPRLKELAIDLLHGCAIFADSADGQDQCRAPDDAPVQSPQQGLSGHQQQDYIAEMLQGTFTMLGLLRMQSESNDRDSMVDTNVGAGWLFSGIAALSTSVASDLREILRQHMKAFLDKTEEADDERVRVRHAGCKLLLPVLSEN